MTEKEIEGNQEVCRDSTNKFWKTDRLVSSLEKVPVKDNLLKKETYTVQNDKEVYEMSKTTTTISDL